MANRRIGGAGGGSDPGPGKSAGTAVAAGTLAVALASSGGAFSTGSAVTAGSEAAIGQSASAAARNVASRIPKKNKSSAQRSIRRGRANEAWKRLGLRKLRQSDKVPALDCVAHSFGEVREFLARSPCRSLDRIIFTLNDAHGNSAIVSVAWVDFRNRSTVRRFERLEDRHGTGDIKALGSSIPGVHDVEFTGHHYNAQRRRTTLTIAEAETLSGSYSTDDLNTIADIASLLPRP